MSEFNGKNKIKSPIKLMFERAKYKNYMNNNKNKAVRDLKIGEFNQYGRINSALGVIYNNGQSLKPISGGSPGEILYACDFVADAFKAIQTRFERAVFQGSIPSNDRYLSKITPVKGYIDPVIAYDGYIGRMLDNYNNIFLKNYQVKNFDDYYKFFIRYATKMGYNYPMTFGGFQRSKHSSIFTTGLAISIADFPADDDNKKEINFIDSPNFALFKSVCLNQGMFLIENTPNVIVADLTSPALSVYTKNYYLSSKDSIFLKYFNYCIDRDIELLINNLLIYYRKYYNKSPYYNDITFCKENKIKVNKIFIEPIDLNEITYKYTNSYMYDLLIKLKNLEEYHHFNNLDLLFMTKRARFLEKTFDNSTAIGYIREEFRKVHKFRHGGLNDLAQKNTEKPENNTESQSQGSTGISNPQGGNGGISGY